MGSIAYPVEGRIPAGQDARSGSYSDSITVTVDF
ncbi:MAG: spore coat protein U domain-containing protein [Steroidobacteraceae bacterium]